MTFTLIIWTDWTPLGRLLIALLRHDSTTLIKTADQAKSVGRSGFSCGWSPFILIPALICSWNHNLVLRAVLHVCHPAFWSLHPFSPDYVSPLPQMQQHSYNQRADPVEADQWVDASFTPGVQLEIVYTPEAAVFDQQEKGSQHRQNF